MKRFWADFNMVTRDGFHVGLREGQDVSLDERVLMRDDEGNSIEGIVTRIKDGTIQTRPDWDTWISQEK